MAAVKEADISCVVVGLMTHKGGPCAWGGHTQVDVHMWEHTRLYSIITSCVAPDDPDDFNTRNSRGFFSSKVCLALTSCTQLLEYSDG